jgi:TolB protein
MRLPAVCLVTLVALIGSTDVASATFPGRNGTIAFAARPSAEPKSLYAIAPTGDGLRHLVARAGNAEDRAPAWSPDGNMLAFASDRSGNLDIWAAAPGSGDRPSNLTGITGTQELLPTWSPAGARLAFTSQQPGGDEVTIDVMYGDGSDRHTIALLDAPVSLEWSPFGARIAYAVVSDGSRDIFTIRPDGTGIAPLARDLPKAVIYDWRPDGRRILFQGSAGGDPGLFEISTKGDHRIRRLTHPTSSVDEHASYSPDGRKIVFVRSSDRGDQLWLMRSDGTRERRLKRFARLLLYGISWQAR